MNSHPGSGRRRIGAYVLPGDPVWLRESLSQYYERLDHLIVPVPIDGLGWTGLPLPVDECLAIIKEVDTRGILTVVPGVWRDVDEPMRAETAQRQAALHALEPSVDWALQLDADEWLPRAGSIDDWVAIAERLNAQAVEPPMRVLYRRTRRHVFEVTDRDGGPLYEYPAPVLVRPDARLVSARHVAGTFVRLLAGRDASVQTRRATLANEIRVSAARPSDAIIHNSWARDRKAMRSKLSSWGHADSSRLRVYYRLFWLPSPLIWWALRNLHPLDRGLWPRLSRRANAGPLADSPTAEDAT